MNYIYSTLHGLSINNKEYLVRLFHLFIVRLFTYKKSYIYIYTHNENVHYLCIEYSKAFTLNFIS